MYFTVKSKIATQNKNYNIKDTSTLNESAVKIFTISSKKFKLKNFDGELVFKLKDRPLHSTRKQIVEILKSLEFDFTDKPAYNENDKFTDILEARKEIRDGTIIEEPKYLSGGIQERSGKLFVEQQRNLLDDLTNQDEAKWMKFGDWEVSELGTNTYVGDRCFILSYSDKKDVMSRPFVEQEVKTFDMNEIDKKVTKKIKKDKDFTIGD